MHPMQPFRDAIASVESGGNYGSVGPPTRNGDRAFGRYQVMGNQVPEWTQSALGYSMTPQDFLKNPEAQDTVFDHYFGGAMNKYGNPQDAASVWFSGRPMSQAGNSDDGYINVPTYVSRFNKALGQPTPETNTPSPMKQAMNSNSNGAPSMADNGILSAVQNYGPGALFGAGRADYDPSMGLMGLGAGLTVAGGDAKGGSGMMNAAMLPMFKQRYSVVSDKYGNQRVFDLHRGGFVSSPLGGAGSDGGGAQGSPQGSVPQPPPQTAIQLPNGQAFQPSMSEGAPGQPGPVLDIEQRKKMIEEAPKEMQSYVDLDNAGQAMKTKTQEMRQLMQDPHFNTGSRFQEYFGDAKAELGGITGSELPGTSQNQLFDKNAKQVQSQWMQSQKGMTRIAQPEIAFGELANPGRDKTTGVNSSILHDYESQADYAHAQRQLAQTYYDKYGHLGPGFQTDLLRLQDTFRKGGMMGGLTDVQPGQVPMQNQPASNQRPPLSSFSK